MSELDQSSDPQLKVEGDQDRFRGRTGATRLKAALTQNASTNTQFEHLMAEHLEPHRTPSPSPPPFSELRHAHRRRRRQGRGEAQTSPLTTPVLHSATHIIDSRSLDPCPLVSEFHSCILRDSTICYLFWTVKGAASLAAFLLCSNSLLHPLPPRPDPP